MIKHIIWDFDGTLFNSYPGIASTYLYVVRNDYGLNFEYKQILLWVKESRDICEKKLAKELRINVEELIERFSNRYSEKGAPIEESPFPGAKEICEKVKSGGGFNILVTHRSYKTLIRLLEKYQMMDYFTKLIAGDNGYPRKPDPTAFLYLLNEYNLIKNEVMAVGDRDLDIQAAKNAGIKSCYFNPDGETHPYADFQVHQLFEIEKYLK